MPPPLSKKPRAVFRVLRGRRPGTYRTGPLLAEVPGPRHCDRILMYLTIKSRAVLTWDLMLMDIVTSEN